MGTPADLSVLRSVALFEELDPAQLSALAEAFETTSIGAGQVLMEQGAPADDFHIVVSGRLRALIATGEGTRRRGEIGRGEPVGEMGLLTGSPRTASVVAIRDSELLTMEAAAFDQLVAAHPPLLRKLASAIIHRSSEEASRPNSSAPLSILVVPINHEPATDEGAIFAEALRQELEQLGDRVALISKDDRVDDVLPMERANDRLVLLYGDGGDRWSAQCRQTADLILLVSDRQPVRPESIGHQLAADLNGHGRVELVLTHEVGRDPSGTATTLRNLADAGLRIARHHHVSLGRPAKNPDADSTTTLDRIGAQDRIGMRGLGRVARLVTQRGVGLVLGGGGARGMAHIGVIRALESHGIAVDAVIGTSAGAMVAGGFGCGFSNEELLGFFVDHLSRSPVDYTVPSAGLSSGKRITELCQRLYGTRQLEDLWIDTSTVSTNLTQDCLSVHTTGPLWRAVRASVSIPVLFPPVQIDGDVHVDGALAANVPVGPLVSRHPGMFVVASDVGIDSSMSAQAMAEDGITGIKTGLKQWLPFVEAEGPSVIRVIGRMVELSTGYGDQPEPALLIKHDLSEVPMFGFERAVQTAERGQAAAEIVLGAASQFRAR